MFDYTDILSSLFTSYSMSRRPIDVDFRSIVNISNPDRLTHFIHPYPAKLLQHIPIFFLNNSLLSCDSSLIYDPFNGSGTVAVESLYSKRHFIGTDINPFACLLSNVKCNYLDNYNIDGSLTTVLEISKHKTPVDLKIINKDMWFGKRQYESLSKLVQSISEIKDNRVSDFFKICFSSTMKKVSNADPRISVPVRVKPEKYPNGHHLKKYYQNLQRTIASSDINELFTSIVQQNKRRIESISNLSSHSAFVFESDARLMPDDKYSNNVDLIITSPPYPGAQKYIRSCSHSISWLELFDNKLIDLKRQVIGREEVKTNDFRGSSGVRSADAVINEILKINKTRATIAEAYLIDMRLVLKSCYQYLKNDGWLVLVAANNFFCKKEFLTLEYLKEIAEEEGFSCCLELVDTIKSYGLMTKRNKNAGIISREGILVLRKQV